MYTLLVFVHLLSASMALGAIVATDLRLLSKLSQDKVRIAPPNAFVARIVMLALLMLWLTGGVIVWHGVATHADYLANPKLLVKIGVVVLLTGNAFMLHRVTFPRLARGRRVPRWTLHDWVAIAVPVAASNFLWMFAAFLGVARAWNDVIPARDIIEIGATLFLCVQLGVFLILAASGRRVAPDRVGWADRMARSLAAIGSLGATGTDPDGASDAGGRGGRSRSTGRSSSSSSSSRRLRSDAHEASLPQTQGQATLPPTLSALGDRKPAVAPPAAVVRPTLRLVDTHGHAVDRPAKSAKSVS